MIQPVNQGILLAQHVHANLYIILQRLHPLMFVNVCRRAQPHHAILPDQLHQHGAEASQEAQHVLVLIIPAWKLYNLVSQPRNSCQHQELGEPSGRRPWTQWSQKNGQDNTAQMRPVAVMPPSLRHKGGTTGLAAHIAIVLSVLRACFVLRADDNPCSIARSHQQKAPLDNHMVYQLCFKKYHVRIEMISKARNFKAFYKASERSELCETLVSAAASLRRLFTLKV
mmetsp:Transcript_25348/g.68867  ORF Transcript_25348/g.68867 Transcript_25348/m.68867 type:complete len:226 (+) Transcript_25348:1039-1716(+)